ncbi:polysialyltransferase family glycosyltransferase [Vibrio lentus]|uniref:polysialyltransferase family glycosyltransferase n=1 Tax=Vibrio lentus TaxID=136468 RepID=UPI000C830BA1|nr:hypothetical protein [Vibrio lentus]PMI05610.1 hypothetical protein BCU53_13835 [Vibrio lentus]
MLVESPIQLESALKSISYFGLSKRNVLFIVRLNGIVKNDNLILSMISNYERVVFSAHERSKFAIFGSFVAFMHYIINFGKINIFMGDWRSTWMRLASFFVAKDKLYIMDDGLATLGVINSLERLKKTERKLNVVTIYPMNGDEFDKIKLFQLPVENITIEHIYDDSILFIGSPLEEKGIISRYDWERYILSIKNDIKNEPFYYFPHRAESKGNLKFISECGFEIIESPLGLEDFIFQSKKVPCYIIGFYSTALVNLKLKSSSLNLISFKLPTSNVNEFNRDSIMLAYDKIEEMGVVIKDL